MSDGYVPPIHLGYSTDPSILMQQSKLANRTASPAVIILLTVVIIMYYIVFYVFGVDVPKTTQKASGAEIFIEVFMWSLFAVLFIVSGIQYYYKINIVTEVKNIFSEKPQLDVTVEQPVNEEPPPPPSIATVPQVFHIRDNKYTYDDAKAICKAYGARLANYKDIEEAYKKGGEWCSYGWSDKQSALFPIQRESWEKLQDVEGHEHDCGRPGINGGYIANPNVKFGVNCYGYKPDLNSASQKLMETETIYPKSEKERQFEKRVKHWRTRINNIAVSPFNRDKWSVI